MSGELDRIAESGARVHGHRRVVAFQDVDAAGIVFYARVFDYFHDAYVDFLRDRGAPLEAALRDGAWVAPLTRAEAEYLRPLRFGDEVEVVIAAIDLAETEYTVEYRVELKDGVAAVGRTRHVSVDPETFRRAPVPGILRRALT
ncbi:MAG: acyl-CoA thioesterase [Candidatus Longimicrobiales bacterium M2_2A_002]